MPELIDCLRDTLLQIERGEDGNGPEIQSLKRKIVLLLAELQVQEKGKSTAA